jgi:MYXO-CTERM domain-containing protein
LHPAAGHRSGVPAGGCADTNRATAAGSSSVNSTTHSTPVRRATSAATAGAAFRHGSHQVAPSSINLTGPGPPTSTAEPASDLARTRNAIPGGCRLDAVAPDAHPVAAPATDASASHTAILHHARTGGSITRRRADGPAAARAVRPLYAPAMHRDSGSVVRRGIAPLVAAAALLGSARARADVVEVAPGDDVEAAMNALAPGDELVLGGGMYVLEGRFGVTIVGTAEQPIVVRAADGERPHFHRADASENIWDLDRAEHVTLRGIELSGGSAGLRITAADHLTVEDCEIHDTGDVALRANDSGTVYESLRILRNHIHHTNNTGEGMYLGCNDNACQVARSLIEGNYVHDTNQASVDQGDGIELKEGSFDNVIRDNVIHDTNYPCILTYSAVGNGGPNIIERNVMWGCGDHGIQSAADAVIRNNLILSAGSDGIAMQPHQAGAPDGLVVVHNTIVKATNAAISLRGAVGSVIVANNAAYAESGDAVLVNGGDLSGVVVAGNVGEGGDSGTGGVAQGDLAADMVMASYAGAPPMDLFPAAGGALIGAGEAEHVPADDFNGSARGGAADVGAYAYAEGGNPGWPLGPGFKGDTPTPSDPDAGAGGGGDAATPPGGDGGTGPGDDDPDDGGGCGCRAGAGGPGAPAVWVAIAAAVAALLRRRRGDAR